MTTLNNKNCSIYSRNTFPTHTAVLSDSLFGGNLKLQLTSLLLQNTEGPASPSEQSYASVRSSYSCVAQQLWLVTNPRKKLFSTCVCYLCMAVVWTAAILLQASSLQNIFSCRSCRLAMTVSKPSLSKKRY